MELSEKDNKMLKTVSLVAGIFALLVAVMMLFGYVQMKRIDPLDNPALLQLKEQFDRDPENSDLQEQVRSLDLIARKAFFTATWQVRAGSYLLLASAIVFILALWMISSADKTIPVFPGDATDEKSIRKIKRQWLLAPAVLIFAVALIASAVMRKNLPSPGRVTTADEVQTVTIAETVTMTTTTSQPPAETLKPENRTERSELTGAAGEGKPATSNQQPATTSAQSATRTVETGTATAMADRKSVV